MDTENTLRDRVPTFAAAGDALDRIEAVTLPPADSDPIATVAEWFETQVREGKAPDGAEVVDIATAAMSTATARAAAGEAIRRVRQKLQGEMQSIRASSVDVILGALDDELGDIVEEATALQPFDEIDTDKAAVASLRAADRNALKALCDWYSRLRRTQLALMIEKSGGSHPRHVLAALVEDPIALLPDYVRWDAGAPDVYPPWPVLADADQHEITRIRATGHRSVAQDAADGGFLLWAIQAGVPLRVKTTGQYRAAVQKIDEAVWGPKPTGPTGKFDPKSGRLEVDSGLVDWAAEAARS